MRCEALTGCQPVAGGTAIEESSEGGGLYYITLIYSDNVIQCNVIAFLKADTYEMHH